MPELVAESLDSQDGIPHPLNATPQPGRLAYTWTCSECEARIKRARVVCAKCGAVLCCNCASKPHRVPAGMRAGAPCG